jgi:chromosome segregation ATPase
VEQPIAADLEQLRVRLAALEDELGRAQARLHQAHDEMAELDRRKEEAVGAVSLAQRAISELEHRLEEQREALARGEHIATLRRELAARAADRDRAAHAVADTVAALLAHLDELAAGREAVVAAHAALRTVGNVGDADDLHPEPGALHEQWERLLDRIRSDLGHEIESRLVEAAARSPLGNAIDDLPAHLRVLATERRRTLIRESSLRRERS